MRDNNTITIDGNNVDAEKLAAALEKSPPTKVGVISFDVDELRALVVKQAAAIQALQEGAGEALVDIANINSDLYKQLAYKVHKPIIMRNTVFVDVETTGLNPQKDRIVELGVIYVDAEGTEHTYQQLINPGFLLAQENIDIHNITNEMLKDAPAFEEEAGKLFEIMKSCKHFVAYNCSFDFQFIAAELERASSKFVIDAADYAFIDPCAIFRNLFPHTLEGAHRFYVGSSVENAHRALDDIKATKVVLEKQFKRHREFFAGKTLKDVQLETVGSMAILGSWFDETEEGVVFRKGKHKGEVVSTSHSSYLAWIGRLEETTPSEKRFMQSV